MKHVMNPVAATGEIKLKSPNRRTLAKQQTRARVLAAARKLFSEQGYEGATIRDIAAAAGMSTGAVFANFTDKSDLFREIMVTDMDALLEAMRDAAAVGGDVEQRLQRIFQAGYAFYQSQMPLARAAFSVSWQPDGMSLRATQSVQALRALFTEQLSQGVARGELIQDPDISLRAQMLFDTYLSNYPQAIFGEWTLEALQARSRDQIRIILAGARPG